MRWLVLLASLWAASLGLLSVGSISPGIAPATSLKNPGTVADGRYDASPGAMVSGTTGPLLLDQFRRLQVVIPSTATPIEVQGTTEDGVAPLTSEDQPVLTGGVDPATGFAQTHSVDATGRSDVNTIVGQAGVQGGSGVVTALTQRTVLATDVGLPAGTATIGSVQVINAQGNPAQVEIGDGTDTATVTAAGELNVLATAQPGVDIGDVTLTAGTATVGSIGAIVNALPAGNNNIGDVDVATLPALVASTATIGSVQVVNAQGNPAQVEIGDGVDTSTVTAAGELNVLATAQPGVDIGDVTLTASTATIGSVQVVNAQANPAQVEIGDGVDTATVTAAGELNVIASAQPGVDLGDVTLTAGTATIGSIGAIVNALPAGGNTIGNVTVSSLPALVAGTATIGSVQVINAQGNPAQVEIGDGTDTATVTAAGELNVIATAQPGVDLGDVTLTAGTATVGSIGAIVNALPAGNNNIGDVDVATLPALVAGTATIGSVQLVPGGGISSVASTTMAGNFQAQGATDGLSYYGFAARELSGAPVVLRVYNGTSSAGTFIDIIVLDAAGAMDGQRYDDMNHSPADAGIFVERVSGTCELIIYYKDRTP